MIRLLIYLVMKQLIPIITELFTRGRKADISLDCITQSYFAVLRTMHFSIMKILKSPKNFRKLCLIIHQILTVRTS